MATLEIADLDLTDPKLFHDHDLHEIWRWLHSGPRVLWQPPKCPRAGFWVVAKYADVNAVYQDGLRFTSTKGNVLSTLLRGHDSASGKMLAVVDGERHRAVRRLMVKSFTPRALAPVLDKVKRRAHRVVGKAVEMGEVDFATEVAYEISINIIGDLMDVPDRDREQLASWNTLALARAEEDDSELDEIVVRNEILMYFSDLVAQRRRAPGDDIISTLVTGTVGGEPLSEEEIVLNCYSLLLSDQSTRMTSVGGALALAQHPAQWRALKEGAAGIDTATDEILRWTTPSMHFGRNVVADAVIGGQPVAINDVVTLWNAAANMDEDAFPNATVFDLGRKPNRHITFGFGPHLCLGAFLGRAHLGAVLSSMRELVTRIEVPVPPTRLYSNAVSGYTSAPMRLVGS
ncbi:cytochrome P450 [Kutzneria sp. CA-103260]|uniref:cytochrome P450 n=1 Tax=Kutzneria sp. CA-103260 TaxID=2802641 RepID=UPI001BA9D86B|nr:cytochrome P450 [Kutzneria sp. CA-103260]QUQ67482.1 cytochrome P450 [Kutzneria sp. CA-103260]